MSGYELAIPREKNGWTICKQWRPWADTFYSIWAVSALFCDIRLCDLAIPREKWLNYLQTVETWADTFCIIWAWSVCQLPFWEVCRHKWVKPKSIDIYLISPQTHLCGRQLNWGNSGEYQQNTFSWKNKKNKVFFSRELVKEEYLIIILW